MEKIVDIHKKGEKIEETKKDIKKEEIKNTEIKKKKIKKKIIEKKDTEEEELQKVGEKEEFEELEENEKIEESEEMEEIEENEKDIIIKLDENLKKHIENKNFILNDKLKIKYKFLYNKISKTNLLNKLDIFYFDTYATIPYKNLYYLFFYKLIPVEINLIYKEETKNKTNKFAICSSYELLEYCKNNNYNPYIEINNDKYEFINLFKSFDIIKKITNLDKIILNQYYRYYDDYKNEKLPNIYPKDNSNLEPEKLSKFFELFFKFETKSNFEYWESQKRKEFISFILKYKTNQEIYCFKICGPSGIGKSMTLFLISKYFNNFLYYNLKTIRILKQDNDNVNIQNIITESCKYLNLNKTQIEKLSSLIEKNRCFPFFTCLKEIINFLIENKLFSVIILDQFKTDSIDKKEYNEILLLISNQKYKNVKLLICSSTNDKEIREECIKSFALKLFSLDQLNSKNQKYFFYINELYNNNEKGNTLYDTILYNFNHIPKYKNKFKYLKEEKDKSKKLNEELDITKQLSKDLKIVKENIETNLKKLYRIINEKDKTEEIITMKMIESLRYLFLNIGEKIKYERLEEFTRICSFKYYTFIFEENTFTINYSFPYMCEIINDIIDQHLEKYYEYKLNDEHSGSANSDFFELFSGKSLKTGILELPESKNSICIRVNEIVEMKEFSRTEKDNLIQNEIYSSVEQLRVKKDDFKGENKEINEELNDMKLLLSINNLINYNDENIDYHKLQYINKLNNEYDIFGNKNHGDMSIFINQKNQRGKKLDLAYVYGLKEEKTFIGFQMKAYDEESSHDCKFDLTKDNLKRALEPMIINIKYLMNMNIKSWHFIAIILYDKRKEEGKRFFKKMVKICENNGLEYIFYEPFENKFYNRYLGHITKFIPNQFSNLDNNIESILPINIMYDLAIDKYMNNFSNYMINNKLDKVNYIKEGLNSLINRKRERTKNSALTVQEKKEDIKNALNDILNNIKIKFGFNPIKFVGAYEFLNTYNIPEPKNNYFFLIPSDEKDIYIILFNIKDMEEVYYKYNTALNIDIMYTNKKKEKNIVSIDTSYVSKTINKKEKFYVFKFWTKENKKRNN